MNIESPTRLAVIVLVAIGVAEGFLSEYFYPGNAFSPVAGAKGWCLGYGSFAANSFWRLWPRPIWRGPCCIRTSDLTTRRSGELSYDDDR
jgi:hypothetical protein